MMMMIFCSRCGRWEYCAQITARDARAYLGSHGWTVWGYANTYPVPCQTCGHIDDSASFKGGVDVCPLCSRDKPATSADAVDLQRQEG